MIDIIVNYVLNDQQLCAGQNWLARNPSNFEILIDNRAPIILANAHASSKVFLGQKTSETGIN